MTELKVRPFRNDDAEKASEILCNAFKSFLADKFDDILAKHFTPEVLMEDALLKDKFKFNESRTFVAEDDGTIVGVVKVTAGVNGLGVFDYVGVDPKCHAHGIGSLLMRKAEEFWKEHKQRKINTCVTAHNKKALLYYIKNNFIPEGYCKDHFHEGVDEIILGRFLQN